MEIISLKLGGLDTNCYIGWSLTTASAVVIDPADDGDTINQTLLENKLTPTAIMLTHAHFDHCLGLLAVQTAWDIPIYLHLEDRFLLKTAMSSARHWLGIEPDPVPQVTKEIEDGQVFSLDENETFVVKHTPGHTPGSVCFVGKDWIATGDTLFAAGVGRTDHSYSSPLALEESLRQLANLPDELTALPGHGPLAKLGVALANASAQ